MKILLALAMLTAGVASASTTVNFGAARSCPTYCKGFVTSNPAYRLNWLNAMYALTSPRHTLLSVNGHEYSGYTRATLVSKIGGYRFYQVEGPMQAANGSTLSVSYMLKYWKTRSTSGKDAGQIVQHRAISGGQLVFP
jgi:hypothetical protein